MSEVTLSLVKCATDTETRDVTLRGVLIAIRTGGKMLRGQVQRIRSTFQAELAKNGGDMQKAKLAIDPLKKALPAVTWSGRFSYRASDKLLQHSGLFCGDLDSLGPELEKIRDKLKQSPFVYVLFRSPTFIGLKAVFRVPADLAKHPGSYRAVEKHVRELCGIQIDQKCKDVARLCFISYDPEIYINENARELEPLPEPKKQKPVSGSDGALPPGMPLRERIATQIFGSLKWSAEKGGYFCTCPGEANHTNRTGEKHAIVYLDRVPTLDCQHGSCKKVVDAFNAQLRSGIGRAERQARRETPRATVQEASGPPPAPYVSPPLDLLPSVLQDYVHAAAGSLNVDVSYVMLPLLSSLAAAIGNARSIILKRGYVQPPVIWTGIIGRSGSRKSPALDKGCFAVTKHDRTLMQQNRVEAERYADELATWDAQKGKGRGAKPEQPKSLTCLMDDMTQAALADAMQENPRGVLAKKDELSHWFASFDQYHSGKGADVSRWLSLHTGVFFGLDRRTDKRCYRIHDPRVCIAGGIQPKVLARVLTEDFFERGLPARFLFAHPPMRQDRWNETTIPDDLREAVLELFEELWLLQPEDHDSDKRPKLLPLDRDAKAVFVDFYNECGAVSLEAGEHEEAAWCKMTGYAARLALVGQLARNPQAPVVTDEVMQAACELALWFGNEAVRIYAELAETQEHREQREFCEFIERRGGTVTVRDAITYYRPLKNQREKAEQQLNALVKAGRGKWEPVPTTPRGGQPTRKFRLLHTSASAEPHELRGKVEGCADADAPNSGKITPSNEPKAEAVSGKLDPC